MSSHIPITQNAQLSASCLSTDNYRDAQEDLPRRGRGTGGCSLRKGTLQGETISQFQKCWAGTGVVPAQESEVKLLGRSEDPLSRVTTASALCSCP